MPRPRVVLSLLFVLLAFALGLRPARLVVGSAHHATRPAPTGRTAIHRGLRPHPQARDAVDAYNTGR
ncbi:MAG TPA: hypothetical protein VFH80_19285 [Solirubrobacteraceae bacterium]|nr:hypothetical protein [Solirubrobacteraceae bacterium]